ncbi:MAG: DNA-3-methyladenine glycosylase [Verrucomicrobia bacterium RIFCSPHIGHO2_12_FULL_41_10]|nr:MAG: DNA-3-methyladenine glycosylase [Verrucomicrobia bacterium RIFCSPHIGHO2_12_FULL_41_10]
MAKVQYMPPLKEKHRCSWVNKDPIYIQYHDTEWGVPIYDERLLFEFLNLEGMQAGLSWLTILKRRDNYRNCFDHFDADLISKYDEAKVNLLLSNPGIIRNKLKVRAIISNAKAFLEVKKEWGDFSKYLWHFVGGSPLQNHWESFKQLPTTTPISDAMSKDLKKRGFKFIGSTICYAFMQAVGMVNDHTMDCYRYSQKLATKEHINKILK